MIESKYGFIEDRQEWMGIVYDESVVLTIGCERTEEEIKEWLNEAKRVQPWIEGNPDVPDLYDRNSQTTSK